MKLLREKILPDFLRNLMPTLRPDPLKCEVIPKVYVKRMEIDDGTSVIVDVNDAEDDFPFEIMEADIGRFEKMIDRYKK